MQTRRKELVLFGRHNLGGFWKELQQKYTNKGNNTIDVQWLEHAKLLYERVQDKDIPRIIDSRAKLSSLENIKEKIKKLVVGKDRDINSLQAKYFKWGLGVLVPHIKRIFNKVIQNGFLTNWMTSVVIPLLKSGNINNPSKYHTIIINPLFGKLFGSMIAR